MKKIIKLDVYQNSDLKVIKSLPWAGGSTTIHQDEYGVNYYTVYVKPRNIIERIVTKYFIKSLDCTFEVERKAA